VKLALLRFAARRPLLSLGLACAAVVGLGVSGICALSPCGATGAPPASEPRVTALAAELAHADDTDPQGKNPRLLLGRLWLDRMPRRPTDEVDLWIFFGGGIGVHETGSRWKGSYEIFDLERRGSSVDLTYLQTKKKVTTSFEITRCDDLPPFNLCLDLKDLPGGPVRLHGFDYDDELDRAMPWGRATLEAARVKATAPRE
jgi:hypothetical protein